MAVSDAERARSYRARKRERDGLLTIAPAPAAGDGPGEVAAAVERTLAAIPGADPALAVLARRLAAHMDASGAVNHQVAAELRRTIGQLRADDRRKYTPAARLPRNRSLSPLEELRRARVESEARGRQRSAGRTGRR